MSARRVAFLVMVAATLAACGHQGQPSAGTPSTTGPVRASTDVVAETRSVPAALVGGLETDPRDRGRPVALVAAGLN